MDPKLAEKLRRTHLDDQYQATIKAWSQAMDNEPEMPFLRSLRQHLTDTSLPPNTLGIQDDQDDQDDEKD